MVILRFKFKPCFQSYITLHVLMGRISSTQSRNNTRYSTHGLVLMVKVITANVTVFQNCSFELWCLWYSWPLIGYDDVNAMIMQFMINQSRLIIMMQVMLLRHWWLSWFNILTFWWNVHYDYYHQTHQGDTSQHYSLMYFDAEAIAASVVNATRQDPQQEVWWSWLSWISTPMLVWILVVPWNFDKENFGFTM